MQSIARRASRMRSPPGPPRIRGAALRVICFAVAPSAGAVASRRHSVRQPSTAHHALRRRCRTTHLGSGPSDARVFAAVQRPADARLPREMSSGKRSWRSSRRSSRWRRVPAALMRRPSCSPSSIFAPWPTAHARRHHPAAAPGAWSRPSAGTRRDALALGPLWSSATHALVRKAPSSRVRVRRDRTMQHASAWSSAQRWRGRERPDTLLLSATPIPRSLALTMYGDLDVSTLDERPPGRLPVSTALRAESSRAVLAFLDREIGKGRQAYVGYR